MPKRLTVEELQLRGTLKPCRHAKREAEVKQRAEEINERQRRAKFPDWLPEPAQKIWKQTARKLPQVLTVTEQSLLEQFCVLKAKMQQDPDAFRAGEHSQLRQLSKALGEVEAKKAELERKAESLKDNPWLKFKQPIPAPKDEYEEWQSKRMRKESAKPQLGNLEEWMKKRSHQQQAEPTKTNSDDLV